MNIFVNDVNFTDQELSSIQFVNIKGPTSVCEEKLGNRMKMSKHTTFSQYFAFWLILAPTEGEYANIKYKLHTDCYIKFEV